MIALLIGFGWTVLSVAVGILVGRCIAFDNREQPLTYDERQALIERSRRRHPAGQHIGPPQEWLL